MYILKGEPDLIVKSDSIILSLRFFVPQFIESLEHQAWSILYRVYYTIYILTEIGAISIIEICSPASPMHAPVYSLMHSLHTHARHAFKFILPYRFMPT